MKKNKLRVIQISGFRGLLSAIFVVACLIAGFVGFPATLLSNIWNHFATTSSTIPEINFFQGLILWGILAVSYMILNKKQKYLIAFEPPSANPQEIKNIIKEIKAQRTELKKDLDTEPSIVKPLETEEVKISNQTEQNDKAEEKTKEVV